MFDIKSEDLKRLIVTNYFLIAIEAPVGLYLVSKFPNFTLGNLVLVVSSILLSTIILHLAVISKASKIIRDIALLFMATTVIVMLTEVMHFIPSIRSALVLMYIPSVIFAASQSLSFGILVSSMMVACFVLLTGGEYLNYHPIFKTAIDFSSLGPNWQVSNLFSFFFLLILAFMANYYFNLLRKRENKIQHLADLNKMLYQKSKTTSDQIFKKMNEALVVVDDVFNVVQYNEAFKTLSNQSEELDGKNILNFKIDFVNELEKYLLEAKKNQTKHIQFNYSNSSRFSLSIHISLIKLSDHETGYIVIVNKHAQPWGSVFDSITRKPVDLVLVRLTEGVNKRVIETKVTDRDGRFGFIVPTGKYYIFVSKEGYKFPSQKSMSGYRGDEIDVKSDAEGVIKINVPIDRVSQT